jgi:hypothetical protein
VVRDIARTARLFEQVLDAREIHDSGPHGFSLSAEKFLLICDRAKGAIPRIPGKKIGALSPNFRLQRFQA